MVNFDSILESTKPKVNLKREYKIGVIGAGFIVDSCHLVAYKNMGFKVAAITAKAGADEVAKKHGIPKVYPTFKELCDDPEIDVVDIAIPPDYQLEVVKYAAKKGKHILCQKPMSIELNDTKEIVKIAEEAGVTLAVNQNCRWAPASRIIKSLLDNGFLGQPVIATIDLRWRFYWQDFCKNYDKLIISNMSIHHLDVFRYWFGEPESITAITTKFPGQEYKSDTIALYTLQYQSGLLASACDDGFTWSDPDDMRADFRIEGTGGIVKGRYGWTHGLPDIIEYMPKEKPGYWYKPVIERKWFPDAFEGTMGDLLMAIDENRQPEISGKDNLATMKLIDAAYLSAREKRAVRPEEIE